MNLMDMFRAVTGANQFAAPGTQGNFGDGLQGIGHSLAQWARYGQGETPAWAKPPAADAGDETMYAANPNGRAVGPMPVTNPGPIPGMGLAPMAPVTGQPIGPVTLASLAQLLQPRGQGPY